MSRLQFIYNSFVTIHLQFIRCLQRPSFFFTFPFVCAPPPATPPYSLTATSTSTDDLTLLPMSSAVLEPGATCERRRRGADSTLASPTMLPSLSAAGFVHVVLRSSSPSAAGSDAEKGDGCEKYCGAAGSSLAWRRQPLGSSDPAALRLMRSADAVAADGSRCVCGTGMAPRAASISARRGPGTCFDVACTPTNSISRARSLS